jgi:(1->4)-alpha-D-glucan 1-alpha-D-glucosylmutase
MVAYMEKASREAKVHTSWTQPNAGYDEALKTFVQSSLSDDRFRQQVDDFVRPLVEPGRIVSLAQTLLKLTAPGVPDIYQGTEIWSHSLVDPDNRQPVDYALRRRLLSELEGATPESVLARADEGLPKLWVVRQALALRRKRPEAFGVRGDYRPLSVSGARANHVVAFTRAESVVTVVPRLVIRLAGEWSDTQVDLPAGSWCNTLTGERVSGGLQAAAHVLGRFPVALLAREDAAAGGAVAESPWNQR